MESKVKDWLEAKEQLAEAKSTELSLRKEICEHILQDKRKGTKKGIIGPYILSATAKLNAKIDKDALKAIWKDLSKDEKKAIRFKPEIAAKEYKKLDERSIIHQTITHTPGTPGLELKSVKEK